MTFDTSDLPAIDLRSDTVTLPTEAMYECMRSAPLGDDALDGDPTARELEGRTAELLGKEAGLFLPSCTMANLVATLVHAGRAEQVIVQADSHLYNAERGAAVLTGAFFLPIGGPGGTMEMEALHEALDARGSRLRTAMLALETSHNSAGGAVPPLAHMAEVHALAAERGAALHIDGARLFNAATFLEVEADRIAEHGDSVAICLSKGLSAPLGAVLAGSISFIEQARAVRRMLGGQQRQVGLVAAAGLVALDGRGRLIEDHVRTARLADLLHAVEPSLVPRFPETNILLVDVAASGHSAAEWCEILATCGVLVRPWGRYTLRCVLHRHIDDGATERAGHAFEIAAAQLFRARAVRDRP